MIEIGIPAMIYADAVALKSYVDLCDKWLTDILGLADGSGFRIPDTDRDALRDAVRILGEFADGCMDAGSDSIQSRGLMAAKYDEMLTNMIRRQGVDRWTLSGPWRATSPPTAS